MVIVTDDAYNRQSMAVRRVDNKKIKHVDELNAKLAKDKARRDRETRLAEEAAIREFHENIDKKRRQSLESRRRNIEMDKLFKDINKQSEMEMEQARRAEIIREQEDAKRAKEEAERKAQMIEQAHAEMIRETEREVNIVCVYVL